MSSIITRILLGLILAGLLIAGIWLFLVPHSILSPIKVGVLHSLTGTMASSETSVVEGTLMAIDEINQAGGLLRRTIHPIVVDSHSDNEITAQAVEKLITQDHVSVIFGCWTSACRKTIKPIIEKYHTLLIYPVQYEGIEESPYIFYTGTAPNQQIIPAIKWAFDQGAKKFFLVGSDYIFPHTANEIIKDELKSLGGTIVGEEYLLLGDRNMAPIIKKIQETHPDFIINTINGDSNIAFFQALHDQGITSDKIPVLSFSINESDIQAIGIKNIVGNYAAWSYFQTVDSPENKQFVQNFKQRYGKNRVTSDPIETAYFDVYLWAQSVEAAHDTHPIAVAKELRKQSFNAPEGVVSIDPDTQHTWRIVRIGKINADGQFDIIWGAEHPVRPSPFPRSRSRAAWEQFLHQLYESWHKNWANPKTLKQTPLSSEKEEVKP